MLVLLITSPKTFADDKCKKISDLDDRLECYEEEEEEARDDLEETRKKQEEVTSKINSYLNDLSVTQAQLTDLQNEINSVRLQIEQINENLQIREERLDESNHLRNKIVKAYYQSGKLSEIEMFLSRDFDLSGFSFSTLVYMFDKTLADQTLSLIESLNNEILMFEANKKESESLKADLEVNQQNLIALKADLDAKRAEAQEKEQELEEEISSLQDKIAELSSKQQAIISQKAGEGIISGYEPAEYKLPDPPFSPAFAAMSYGGYTHYKGMSQYGARGRANDGKSYKDIIKFYYGEGVDKKDSFPDEICVEGYGEMSFQKYLYGLAEMPSDWPDDALKAQAIAGRSYAYRRTKGGGCICTTQSCQVFLKSKSDSPPSKWKDAVDDTKDMIIGGSLDASGYGWYSSTTGGYIDNVGWDRDGKWPQDAYEKKAKSPWFYKAWYTETYNDGSSKCGRDTPWLKESEMADILNAWRVWRKGSSSEKDHISPVTTNCWGGDPYSHDEMKEKAGKYGDSYSSVSSVRADISDNGYTYQITFGTNKGNVTIPGEEFKTVFNLRAPGYVSLRSRLFDIEMED